MFTTMHVLTFSPHSRPPSVSDTEEALIVCEQTEVTKIDKSLI